MPRREDGEPSRRSPGNGRGTQHGEPETTGRKPGANHSGNGKRRSCGVRAVDQGDALVDVERALQRHRETRTGRLKESTLFNYERTAILFAKFTQLETRTRKQLSGKLGKRLIVDYILGLEDLSRRQRLSGVQSFWTFGLDLPWPIDKRRDLPKLPHAIRVETPPDHVVKAWAEAMEHENDPRAKLAWYLIAQHGLRPQHVCLVKWRNVRYDEAGSPSHLLADGAVEKFKTHSRVLGAFAPNTAAALKAWADANPGRLPTDLVIPSDRRGRLDWQRPMSTTKQFNRMWRALRAKYDLPDLSCRQMRHWVKSTCRAAELSVPATCALQGHDSGAGGISNYYDNPSETVIVAEQRERLPFGPLARLGIGPVVRVGDYPREVERLLADYFAGRLKQGALVDSLAELRAAWRPGEPLLYPNMLG